MVGDAEQVDSSEKMIHSARAGVWIGLAGHHAVRQNRHDENAVGAWGAI